MYHLDRKEEFRHLDALLDAVSGRGACILGLFRNRAKAEAAAKEIETCR